MSREAAKKLIEDTFQSSFNKEKFVYFSKNLLNTIDEDKAFQARGYVPESFKNFIKTYERVGTYTDPQNKKIDIVVVYLQKKTTLERARTAQRNFIANYLKTRAEKDAGLIAFVSSNPEDWRFSFVKMEYKLQETPKGSVKAKEEFTPARRYSFIVGEHENSHTAQSRLVPILENDQANPTLEQLEDAFSIEKVTKEFFEKYRELFLKVKETLDEIIKEDNAIKNDFNRKGVDTVGFAKKLLGQIVFLYFLQKKGWFGVERDAKWGTGPKNFLRQLFDGKHGEYKNLFNDILEPLFYEALAIERSGDFYSRFNCKIPFLNGGLFDPINNYDWVHTDILLPDLLFSNNETTKEGDIGSGILDVFDRYNFTVKEDEPLEKEVAVDPEMLGKVFENLLEVKDRKSKGTYYTPREIVHYMCQESLTNYLVTELGGKISKEDIETLINYGETAVEHDAIYLEKLAANPGYKGKYEKSKLPPSIERNSAIMDEKLCTIRICDPAVGSGAFLVGMMNEIVRTRNALTNFATGNKDKRTMYSFKRHAIQTCLYGADIDPGAIEIAKLRLWLSLVVDEEDIKQIKPLPNLDYKIVQGNSLLGFPYTPQGLEKIEQLKQEFFEETRPKTRKQLRNEIDKIIKELFANTEKSLGYKVDFDFKIFFSEVFHEKKGFDVVIANPPYVDSETMTRTDPDSRALYSSTYKSASGNWDLFIVFIERGIQILKAKGTITYIIPNKLLAARYAETLREVLLEKDIKEIRDFSKVDVFKEVAVYPVVFLIQNKVGKDPVTMTSMKSLDEIDEQNMISAQIFYKDTDWSRYLAPKTILELVLKISSFPPLSKYCKKISGAATVSEAYEIKKHISEMKAQEKRYKKLCNTGTIDRYLILWGKKKTQYIKSSYCKPVLRDEDLQTVNPQRLKQANSEKIIIGGMTKELECAYDEGEFLAGKSTTIILIDPQNKPPLKVVLALLNSSLISFWYKYFFSSLALAGGYLRISEREISQIPIPEIPKSWQNDLSNLVDKILAITKDKDYLENPSLKAKVRDYEKQIDQMVYKLYGLTKEEIAIIE